MISALNPNLELSQVHLPVQYVCPAITHLAPPAAPADVGQGKGKAGLG